MGNAGNGRWLRGLPACALAALLFAAGSFAIMPVQAQAKPTPPVERVGSTIVTLDPARGRGDYPVYASVDLQAGSATARRALVIIHGRLRNAADYFATGLALAKAAGPVGEATIVVAPQFLNPADVTAHHLAGRYLRWNDDWAEGRPAQNPAAAHSDDPAASSYDVLDDVVAKLSNTSAFPQLQRIVFVGHGGGAQMLARYAVVMRPQPGPAISFVIANAGTYLYPTTARPLPPDCQDFNKWKYGFDNPPPYVGDVGKILHDFAARDITLLLGAKDRKSNGVLDQSCAAQAQGRNRLERGRNYVGAMTTSGMAPLLKHAIVHGAGHDEKKMLLSTEARNAIFATGDAGR
jgi:hypothetical protein